MIELPEALTLGEQLNRTLKGKTVTDVLSPTYVHKFTFFNSEPASYKNMLVNKEIKSAKGFGIFVDILFDNDITLTINDGVNVRYGGGDSKIPDKYQLLITFSDNTFLVYTVAMYGGIYVYEGNPDNKYYLLSENSTSPLSGNFNEAYFENLIVNEKKDISVKALLATEQRIPGIGNGVLHDILFNAGIQPKLKISKLTDEKKKNLFNSVKNTLKDMAELGGRDTETDLFGNKGGYKTILSKNTYKKPCPKCGNTITKESYMGGTVYYCSVCQHI